MIVPPETAVVTLWDLIPFHRGLRHVQRRPALYSVVTMLAERNLLEYPSVYVTISDTVRREMHEYYEIPLDRIRVARPSADLDLFRPVRNVDVPFPRDKVNLLHVGTAVPRKNILGIVEAIGRLGPGRFRLIRVGPPTDPRVVEQYVHRAKELGVEILELGYVPDERLAAYYSAADLVLFPSTFEGAGIPPLEAMACGTNVVVSEIPVHREMCGDAAFYCRTDSESIADAIDRALASPRPPDFLRAHVTSWTWDDVADVYLKIYEELGLEA
jgi:glycosyltransferase involved in cell wall biosynthesis